MSKLFFCWMIVGTCLLLANCTPRIETPALILTDAGAGQRTTLTITLQNARDQENISRDGTLTLTSINDGQRQMMQIVATGRTAPLWLTTVDGHAVFVTADDERRIVDTTCTRDASGFPPVSMRDILGPLHGFTRTDEQLQSTQGGVAWERFVADARTNADGTVTHMNGQGRGKLLLPGSDVIRADMTWTYAVEAYPVAIVYPQQHCEAIVFAELSFPADIETLTTMGSALLLRSKYAQPQTRDILINHWQSLGLHPRIQDQNDQSTTLELPLATQLIRIFLVQSDQFTDITVIRVTP